jgi:hypothetical protein
LVRLLFEGAFDVELAFFERGHIARHGVARPPPPIGQSARACPQRDARRFLFRSR